MASFEENRMRTLLEVIKNQLRATGFGMQCAYRLTYLKE